MMKTNLLPYAAGLACACALLEASRRPSAFVRLVTAVTRLFRRHPLQ